MLAAVCGAAAVVVVCGVPAAQAVDRPVPIAAPLPHEDGVAPPPGANDYSCTPTAAHPRPTILVHGTWDNQNSWNVLAPALVARGYCVFTVNYGRDPGSVYGAMPWVYGTGDMDASAAELAGVVDRVRSATGARQVDIVGHSQGALIARQYLRFHGGADPDDPARNAVRRVVSIAGTNHGTTMQGIGLLVENNRPLGDAAALLMSRAAIDQVVGSPFLDRLNAGGDTEPGVDYTVITTHVDTTATPPEASFLTGGAGATVSNLWLQDVSPGNTTGHAELPRDPAVVALVGSALDAGTR